MRRPMRILHLEDDLDDAKLVQVVLARDGLSADIRLTTNSDQYLAALICGGIDLILADIDIPGFDGLAALEHACKRCPATPFIFISAYPTAQPLADKIEAAGIACVSKADLSSLPPAIRRACEAVAETASTLTHNSTDQLINIVQELSLARDLDSIMAIVRRAARELTGADGATFILRDNEQCYYAEEDAIEPLWKGKRFPMTACISGWAMLNKQPAVIEDIYVDARIPIEAYRPTFVKSLAMVPIRTAAPVGAIGNYWATRHLASSDEVKLLQALADSTSIAMENVQLYGELEQRVRDRTEQLQAANKELETFSYSVSHDLRAPLRAIEGFSRLLMERVSNYPEEDRDYLVRIHRATLRMSQLVDDLLSLSRISQAVLTRDKVDLSTVAQEVLADLQATSPERQVTCSIQPNAWAAGDPRLLRVVLENLLSNAWKYTSKRPQAQITFGCEGQAPELVTFYVQDNGAGFDMTYAGKLFGPFQRLHAESDFPGTGIGLATVQRIVHRHGGRIWAEAALGQGATFYFTLEESTPTVR